MPHIKEQAREEINKLIEKYERIKADGRIRRYNEKNAKNLCNSYSRRWGIETSYRVKDNLRPKTTSKNYVVRLFYFLFSVCLYNLWILANVFIGVVIGRMLKKPLITAKMFGTLLYTTFLIDDEG